jgi:hypothetical protein
VSPVTDPFPGVKNGRKIGRQFCIAVSGVGEVKILILKSQIPIK